MSYHYLHSTLSTMSKYKSTKPLSTQDYLHHPRRDMVSWSLYIDHSTQGEESHRVSHARMPCTSQPPPVQLQLLAGPASHPICHALPVQPIQLSTNQGRPDCPPTNQRTAGVPACHAPQPAGHQTWMGHQGYASQWEHLCPIDPTWPRDASPAPSAVPFCT